MELTITFAEIEPPSGWTSRAGSTGCVRFGGWLELMRAIEEFLDASGREDGG